MNVHIEPFYAFIPLTDNGGSVIAHVVAKEGETLSIIIVEEIPPAQMSFWLTAEQCKTLGSVLVFYAERGRLPTSLEELEQS